MQELLMDTERGKRTGKNLTDDRYFVIIMIMSEMLHLIKQSPFIQTKNRSNFDNTA